jgi:hypothetical protein
MVRKCTRLLIVHFGVVVTIVWMGAIPLTAQQTMSMPGMENSVGFMSSGTSILPKSTSESEPMIHTSLGRWTFMFHAKAFIVDLQQSGPRGADKFFAPNWLMPMLTRQFGRHAIGFRTMLSLDPITVTKRRYPQLFQSGETAYGLPIVDGQHPHDLLMEIAGRYDLRINEKAQVFVYGGPLAEPALGPTAFPHRSSASENPFAVLSHHQQDSTHISNSVVTVGLASGPLQIEASTFHGREPNENRWNIDGGKPDSFASRLTLSATNNWSGQFSIGRINSREALEPELDTVRTTASIHHNIRFSSGHAASSLIWGRNKDIGHHGTHIFNGYTAESTIHFLQKNWLWTRIENVDRDRTLLIGERPEVLDVEHEPVGRVQAYTFGYERKLPIGIASIDVGLGAQFTTYGLPSPMKALYGERPAGFAVFLRIRPTGNVAQHMQLMHQH